MPALDVFGSLSMIVPGTTISCREVAAAMALVMCATEAEADYSVNAFEELLTYAAMQGGVKLTQAVRVPNMSSGRFGYASSPEKMASPSLSVVHAYLRSHRLRWSPLETTKM